MLAWIILYIENIAKEEVFLTWAIIIAIMAGKYNKNLKKRVRNLFYPIIEESSLFALIRLCAITLTLVFSVWAASTYVRPSIPQS